MKIVVAIGGSILLKEYDYKTKQHDDSRVYNLQNRCTQLEEDKRVIEDKLLLANQIR